LPSSGGEEEKRKKLATTKRQSKESAGGEKSRGVLSYVLAKERKKAGAPLKGSSLLNAKRKRERKR